MIRTLLFAFFIIFLSQKPAMAQDWKTITNMNNVVDLAWDSNHFWAVSDGGLYRYNPLTQNIKTYSNMDGLLSVNIKNIEIDSAGNVIIATPNGILQYLNSATNQWYKVETDDVFEMDHLTLLDKGLIASVSVKNVPGKALIYAVWQEGQYIFKEFFVNFPQFITEVYDIKVVGQQLVLSSDKGLFYTNKNDFNQWHQPAWLSGKIYTALTVYNNLLWGSTENRLYKIVEEQQQAVSMLKGDITALEAMQQNLLLASKNKVYTVTNSGEVSDSSTFSNNVQTILPMAKEFWVGLNKKGITSQNGTPNVWIDGPQTNGVRYVIQDNKNRIWASAGKFKLTLNEGFSVYDGSSWKGYDYSGHIWADKGNTDFLYADKYDNVWLGAWGGGLTSFNNAGFNHFHSHGQSGFRIETQLGKTEVVALEPISSNYKDYFSPAGEIARDYEVITAIKEDGRGNLWIVNSNAVNGNYIAVAPYTDAGYLWLDKSKWTYFGETDGISPALGEITSIEFDDLGRVWIGTHLSGVIVLDYQLTLSNKADDIVYTAAEINGALFSNYVTSLAKDSDGIIWIGTKGGLHSFDGLNTFRHDGNLGPNNNIINQVIVDSYNHKWIATEGGLNILKGNKSPFEEDGWVTYTTTNSGLVNNNVHSVFINEELGQALLGTEGGISVFKGAFSETRPTFNDVTAGPNPFRPGSTEAYFTIYKLKNSSTVKIYTLNGLLLRELNTKNEMVEGSRAMWDGKDANGRLVEAGIYLFLAYTEDGKAHQGKIAVIR